MGAFNHQYNILWCVPDVHAHSWPQGQCTGMIECNLHPKMVLLAHSFHHLVMSWKFRRPYSYRLGMPWLLDLILLHSETGRKVVVRRSVSSSLGVAAAPPLPFPRSAPSCKSRRSSTSFSRRSLDISCLKSFVVCIIVATGQGQKRSQNMRPVGLHSYRHDRNKE